MRSLTKNCLALLIALSLVPAAWGVLLGADNLMVLPVDDSRAGQARELRAAFKMAQSGQLQNAIDALQTFRGKHPRSAAGAELLGAFIALNGDEQMGIKLLQQAVQLNANQVTAYTKLGDIYRALGDLANAEKNYELAVNTAPTDERAYQRLGLIAEERGEVTQAIAHFERGIRGTPYDYLGVKVNLARLYNSVGRFGDARGLLASRENELSDAKSIIVLATSLLNDGQPKEGMRLFNRAVQLEPGFSGSHLALGIGRRQTGDLKGSLRSLDRALTIKPNWALGHWQRGDTLVALEEQHDAMDAYAKAAELSQAQSGTTPAVIGLRLARTQAELGYVPDAIKAYEVQRVANTLPVTEFATYGKLLEGAGQLQTAQKLYDQWLEQYPSTVAYQQAGRIRAVQGQYAAASELLIRGTQQYPEDANLLWLHANTLQRMGDYAGAIKAADASIKQRSTTGKQFFLAAMYESNGQVAEAEQGYQRILQAEPKHPGALNNLAVIKIAQEKYAQAVDLAEQAATVAPDDPFVADTLGWALFKAKEPAKALAVLEKAADSKPQYAPLFYHLAESQNALGNKAEARRNLERALSISADFPESENARALMKNL